MESFFKGIGKGILNILLLPVFIVGLALSAAIGIVVFIFEFFIKVGKFFTGKSLSNDLPEDIKAKEMIAAASASKQEKQNSQVEIVQAEIADPVATYKQIAKEAAVATAIESHEDIDFIIDDVPLQIDVSVKNTPEPVIQELPVKEDKEKIEEYHPKGSNF